MRTRLALLLALPLTLGACSKNEPTSIRPSPAPPADDRGASHPAAAPAAAEAPASDETAAAKLSETSVKDSDAFTFRLLGSLSSQQGNLVVSGASLRSALGMLELGAKGSTKTALDDVLRLPAAAEAHVAEAKADAAAWKASAGEAELAVANRVWVDLRSKLEPAYTKSVTDAYGASAANVDFVGAAEPSRGTINAWVAKATNDRIRELLPRGAIDHRTRVVLTNAVYFKGSWAHPFPENATTERTFYAEDGELKRPFMRRMGSYRTATVKGVEVLELPYEGSDLAMVVLLPPAKGLAALEGEVAKGGLDAFVGRLAPAEVQVSLPKFSFRWGRSVKPELEALGLRVLFGDEADLSGMRAPGSDLPLFVTDVFHEAFVRVDEKGTEATGASGVVVGVRGAPRVKTFEANRPFLFAIRDTKTGRALFVGRLAKPEG